MNHIAINVRADKFDDYYNRLIEKGIEVTPVLNHDDSPTQSSAELHPGVFVRSVYFFDPDGVCLEFAAWTKIFDESDVAHDPVQADGTKRDGRSEEHTSELQSLMRISYAVFCLNKKKKTRQQHY